MIQRLGKSMGTNSGGLGGRMNASVRRRESNANDMMALDKLVTSLLDRQQQQQKSSNPQVTRASTKLGRLKSLSLRDRRTSARASAADTYGDSETRNDGNSRISNIPAMPTILESSHGKRASLSEPATNNMSSGIRHVINSIKNAPQRFSHGEPASDNIQLVDENAHLRQNILD